MFKVKTEVCPGMQLYTVVANCLHEQACTRELTLEIQVINDWLTITDTVGELTLAFKFDNWGGTVASWTRNIATRVETPGPDFEIYKEKEIEEHIQLVFGLEV